MLGSHDLGPAFAAVNIAVFILATISFALRCYVRAVMINAFGQDDYWMMAAMLSFIANTTFALLSVRHGSGQHIWRLESDDIVLALKFTHASQITYGTTMILSKISIARFLLRLTPDKVQRRIIYTAACLTCAAGLALVLIVAFQCKPISFFWDKSQDGSCMPTRAILISTYCYSSFAVLTDFTFTLLPLYLIWKLQMDTKSKITLAPVMSLAFVASLAVVIRLPYVDDFTKDDFLYATSNFAIWSAVEQGLAITAGSLATLRPLLRKAVDTLRVLTSSLWTRTRSSEVNSSGYVDSHGFSGSSRRATRKAPHSIFSLDTFNFTRMHEDPEDRYQQHLESNAGRTNYQGGCEVGN